MAIRKPKRQLKRRPNQKPKSEPKSERSESPASHKILPSAGKGLLHLPTELLQLICESLVSTTRTKTESKSTSSVSSDLQKELRVNRSQLLNFSLTCKAIHVISEGILYGHLIGYHFTSTWETFHLIIRSLDSNPRLRTRIRSIDFRAHPFPNMEQTLTTLPEERVSLTKRLFRTSASHGCSDTPYATRTSAIYSSIESSLHCCSFTLMTYVEPRFPSA